MAELVWLLEDGQEQSLRFDATVTESHEASATITEHPIEDGASISDHVRADLDRVTLQVVVSNTPIVSPTDHNDGITGRQGSVGLADGLARAQVLIFDSPLPRVRSVYEELLDLMKSGTTVRLITTLREYDSLGILRVSPVREAASGDSLIAAVELREVRVVESEVVSAPEPRQTRGNTERERGRNNTEADDETETRRSALAYIADSAGSFFR